MDAIICNNLELKGCYQPPNLFLYYRLYIVDLIETLQFRYRAISSEIESLSLATEPSFYYFYIFPIAYALAPGIGLAMLLVACLGDYVSTTLKLCFEDDRPYWWVLLNRQAAVNVTLKQFPRTCDATYGFPSSNMFVTAGSYWCIFIMIKRYRNTCEQKALLVVFSTWTLILGCSEIYLSKNFPDQIIVSIIMGICFANKIIEWQLYSMTPFRYFAFSGLLLTTAYFFVMIVPYLGWRVHKSFCFAHDYCLDTAWTYPQRKIFMLPYIEGGGVLSGTGTALLLNSVFYSNKITIKFNTCKRVSLIILSILLIKSMQCIFHPGNLHETNIIMYNFFLFVQLFTVPMIVCLVMPRFLKLYN